MNQADDNSLLRRFVGEHDEGAFGLLVGRHLPMVHAAASRQLGGDAHLADDVAQVVFSLLAKKAGRLCNHPTLAGWLFTATRHAASAARRTAKRRNQREWEAAIMDEPRTTNEPEASWENIRPVLDEALAMLGTADRERILLRFFEGNSYASIADKLGTKENTARMRVERALEKLREVLRRRGVTSTAAALASVLTSHAAPAVTEGFVSQIASQALAASTVGAASGMAGALEFMSKLKIATVVTVAALGVAVYEGNDARRQSRRASALAAQVAEIQNELADQKRALADAGKRAQAADEDNARLLGAISRAGESFGVLAARDATTQKISRAEAQRRFEHAKALAAEKHYDEALKEYLWCFDIGMRGFAYFDYRYSELPAELAKLSESYPAAIALLRDRRAEFLRRAVEDEHDMDAVFDFALLSKALHDPTAVVEAMNRFPPGDDRRGTLLNNGAYDTLLEARSYSTLIAEKPYDKMDKDLSFFLAVPLAKANAKTQADYRSNVLKNSARDFEILLGSGDDVHARALAGKILSIDGSPESRALLAERAKRAGRANWTLP